MFYSTISGWLPQAGDDSKCMREGSSHGQDENPATVRRGKVTKVTYKFPKESGMQVTQLKAKY